MKKLLKIILAIIGIVVLLTLANYCGNTYYQDKLLDMNTGHRG